MNDTKKTFILAFLILISSASFALSQTRKTPVRRQPSSGRKKPNTKPVAPAIKAAATTTASGLTYIVTDHGTGALLKAGDTVLVNYTGLFTNGSKFDSSLDRGEPISFELGAGKVIKGWDEGLQKLRVGDKATFIIPPQIAYGALGKGSIPPETTLIFIVEVVGVQ